MSDRHQLFSGKFIQPSFSRIHRPRLCYLGAVLAILLLRRRRHCTRSQAPTSIMAMDDTVPGLHGAHAVVRSQTIHAAAPWISCKLQNLTRGLKPQAAVGAHPRARPSRRQSAPKACVALSVRRLRPAAAEPTRGGGWRRRGSQGP